MGHKIVKVTVTDANAATVTKTVELWNQSDYIRPGVWSNGSPNELLYETHWNRGFGTFKQNSSLSQATLYP
jgi:hypothetical protein